MKPSVEVLRHERSSNLVRGAFTVHGPRGASRLTQRLERFLPEGQTVPDLWLLMQLLLSWLTTVTREMVEADLDNEQELANDKKFRNRRDSTVKKLTETLVALRDSCASLYGAAHLGEIGFSEQTPRNPLALLNVGKKLIELLTDPEAEPPVPRFGNLTLDPAAMAQVVEPEVLELGEVLVQVDEEVKKAQSTQAVKNEKVATYKTDFFWIARWLEATFALAGMLHESERVKPSNRRRGRTEVEPEPEQDRTEAESESEEDEAQDRSEP